MDPKLFLNQYNQFSKQELPFWVQVNFRLIQDNCTITLNRSTCEQHLQDNKSLKTGRQIPNIQNFVTTFSLIPQH